VLQVLNYDVLSEVKLVSHILQDCNKKYRLATLQASEMGANVYRQRGFQEYSKMGLYLWSGKAEIVS
jgi:hypothetical protein